MVNTKAAMTLSVSIFLASSIAAVPLHANEGLAVREPGIGATFGRMFGPAIGRVIRGHAKAGNVARRSYDEIDARDPGIGATFGRMFGPAIGRVIRGNIKASNVARRSYNELETRSPGIGATFGRMFGPAIGRVISGTIKANNVVGRDLEHDDLEMRDALEELEMELRSSLEGDVDVRDYDEALDLRDFIGYYDTRSIGGLD